MRKVYIPNKSGHNYGKPGPSEEESTGAYKYGDVVFVTAGTQNKYSVNQMTRVWQDVLKDSSPEDMIVLTGLNIICSLGTAIFAKKHGRINLLLWKGNRYIKREEILEDI